MLVQSLSFCMWRNQAAERISSLIFFSCYLCSWGKLLLFPASATTWSCLLTASTSWTPMSASLLTFLFMVLEYLRDTLWFSRLVIPKWSHFVSPAHFASCFPLFSNMSPNVKTNEQKLTSSEAFHVPGAVFSALHVSPHWNLSTSRHHCCPHLTHSWRHQGEERWRE